MNILSLDTACSPFFSMIVERIERVDSFTAIFSKSGYKHYFSGQHCEYLGNILREHKVYSKQDLALALRSNNHYSAYARKIEQRKLNEQELIWFASFANYFRLYLSEHKIDFVMLHNDLRWQHAIAREICIEERVPFCVSELGLFRPYTTTLDFHGVNANSSITKLDLDFTQYANQNEIGFDTPSPFRGHESKLSKIHFGYFLIANKLGEMLGHSSPILHNQFRIRPYLKRLWKHSVERRVNNLYGNTESLPDKPYLFFPMQLENDTQLLIHSDFSSNQLLLEQLEEAFYSSSLADTHLLVVKLHPNDLGQYKAKKETVFTKAITRELVNHSDSVVSVNSTVCIEVLETNKPLFVLGRALFARDDICQPVRIRELSDALSNPTPVNVEARKGFLSYLRYEYSVHGAGFSYTDKQLQKIAKTIEQYVQGNVTI